MLCLRWVSPCFKDTQKEEGNGRGEKEWRNMAGEGWSETVEGAGGERGGMALPEVSWHRTPTACAQPHTRRACLMLDSSQSSVCFPKAMSLLFLLSLPVERACHGARRHLHRAQSSSISATSAIRNSSGKTHSSAGSRWLLTFREMAQVSSLGPAPTNQRHGLVLGAAAQGLLGPLPLLVVFRVHQH